jgi:hypothetical protein
MDQSAISHQDAHRASLARLRELLGELGAEVDRVKQDAGFAAALTAMSRFWRYSPLNAWSIRHQYPEATEVTSRRAWSALGHTIRDGEPPIYVSAPTNRSGFAYVQVPVFDIAQTEGPPLPRLTLDLDGPTAHVATLERAAARLGVRVVATVRRDDIAGESMGGEIHVAPWLSEQDRVATLAHELAHELLHTGEAARAKPRRRPLSHAMEETEAEATAHVVLRVLGLPSTAPTYIAWRGGSGALVASSLGRIQRAARAILEVATQRERRPRRAEAA